MQTHKVCMLGTSPNSKGGIGTVVKGFGDSVKPRDYSFDHIVTHADYGKAGKLALALAAYLKCLVKLTKNNYDLVHMHSAFGASFTRSIPFIELAAKRGVPIVNHLHSDDWEMFYNSASAEKRDLISRVYNKCDRLIVLSEEWRTILSSVVSCDKIVVLENFSPIFDASFLPDYDCRVVVFMSRIEKIKGCDILPQICEMVVSRVPDATFLICGEGSMEDSLRNELADRSLESSVKLMGWIDSKKKIDLLKSAALFLLPSYGEGMPMCILEAMGLGLPVVSTDVGGVPRLVENGVNGYLCEPGNAEAIACAIVSLLEHPETLHHMGVESKARAASRSVEAYGKRLKVIYDDLIDEVL